MTDAVSREAEFPKLDAVCVVLDQERVTAASAVSGQQEFFAAQLDELGFLGLGQTQLFLLYGKPFIVQQTALIGGEVIRALDGVMAGEQKVKSVHSQQRVCKHPYYENRREGLSSPFVRDVVLSGIADLAAVVDFGITADGLPKVGQLLGKLVAQ